ncbi:hypothetical protein ACFWYW_56735 [Nonomuraea sp. NPDC059023]|uniref:hypothetical protein n=1 Tax=unclassified Nonomuraea TaxID=2593643 RepID=UPI00369EC936
MFGTQQPALPPASSPDAPQPAQPPAAPRRGLLALAAHHLIWRPARALLLWEAKRMWRHRDYHAPWWTAAATYVTATIAHLAEVPWWASMPALAAAVTGVHLYLSKHDLLPVATPTVTGAAAALAAWAATTIQTGPVTGPAAIAWSVLTLATTAAWGLHREARRWRKTRARVRVAAKTLPKVLAELGFPGVQVVGRPRVSGTGRVEYALRLPVKVTRAKLHKATADIESGMHWAEHSLREIIQDPDHNDAARVLLVQHEGKVKARTVTFAPPTIPTSVLDAAWLGVDEDGRDVYVANYVPDYGMTRGMYVGESGSAKSNLMRLITWMRAHCPDALLWIIDLKNDGMTYAELLPRLDRPIATTWEAATRLLQDADAAIPLRGRLLQPEDNQVLPVNHQRPAILIIGDEVSTLLGKARANAAPIHAAKQVGNKGRSSGIGMEATGQYMSQGSMHPELVPVFNRRYAGRTAAKADAQQVLMNWNKLETPLLPTGVFYCQQSGKGGTTLLYTPHVTDAMLAEAAAQTARLTPALEESTAANLPYYPTRWADLPDHLMRFCTEEQQQLVHQHRAERQSAELQKTSGGTKAGMAAAAADDEPPQRLTVTEEIDIPAEVLVSAIPNPHLRAMVLVHLSPGLVSTGGSNAAAMPRSRAWATERRAAWERLGLVETPAKGKWRRIVGEDAMVRGALAAEDEIRARRTGTGENEEPNTGETKQETPPVTCKNASVPIASTRAGPPGARGRGGAARTTPGEGAGETPPPGHGP